MMAETDETPRSEDIENPDEVREQIHEEAAAEGRERAKEVEAEQPTDTRDDPSGDEDDLLVGTGSELAPGTGGGGEHPAPAVMRDPESGYMRQHGEALNTAGDQAPIGDMSDETAEGGLTDEAREALNQVTEPESVETDRIDLGTTE